MNDFGGLENWKKLWSPSIKIYTLFFKPSWPLSRHRLDQLVETQTEFEIDWHENWIWINPIDDRYNSISFFNTQSVDNMDYCTFLPNLVMPYDVFKTKYIFHLPFPSN